MLHRQTSSRRNRMQRIAFIERKDMNSEQARAWDAATQDPDAPVGGPYPVYLRLPKLFEAMQKLRACLASGPLSTRERQIVNLTVARHWNAPYPWFAQVRRSRAAGIPQAVIDAINARETPDLPDARERTCHSVARDLLAEKGLGGAVYAEAEQTMGLEDVVALVAATGNFSMTCLAAIAFQIAPPAANPTPLKE
jgi:4-carboxymuconolactone decarboxylase